VRELEADAEWERLRAKFLFFEDDLGAASRHLSTLQAAVPLLALGGEGRAAAGLVPDTWWVRALRACTRQPTSRSRARFGSVGLCSGSGPSSDLTASHRIPSQVQQLVGYIARPRARVLRFASELERSLGLVSDVGYVGYPNSSVGYIGVHVRRASLELT
jgi:hypothetical protein